jgi:hypothetical protein
MGHRAIVGVGLGALATSTLLVRRWHLRWGADDDETSATLPGDEFLDEPDLVATRAGTIGVAADEVWPWLAQLGQGRGGLYSYDALENLVARCDMHSADRIVPEWQDIAVGDDVRLHPEVALEVVVADPGRALVLRGAAAPGAAPAPYDFTWAFVLRDRPDGTTRLVIRERYTYGHRWVALLVEPIEAVSFVMSQKMIRGIRDRAESRTNRVEPAVAAPRPGDQPIGG